MLSGNNHRGRHEMKFKYRSETFTIESSDQKIFVRRMGTPRESGTQFLLSMNGRNFGFQTAQDCLDEQSERLPDGTYVWRIDVVLSHIDRWDDTHKSRVDYADTFKFQDVAEQELVLSLFAQALSTYDGYESESEAGRAKARVEYTDRVRRQMASGELIQ